MKLTEEEENAVMGRYDQTDPKIRRSLCLALACKCIEAELKVAELRELLEKCKPFIKTPLAINRDFHEEERIESLLARIESVIS